MMEAGAVPNAGGDGLAANLREEFGYEVFTQNKTELYARKGLVGKLAPIWVHVSLLIALFGTAYVGFGDLGLGLKGL